MDETEGHLTETTNNPSTPLPSIPIQLSGFLSGDTIQVQGDTDKLQFSVQFNIHHKLNSDGQFHFPGTFSRENQTPLTSRSSSYMTPTTTHEVENQNVHRDPLCDAIDWTSTTPQDCNATNKDIEIVTRLRSGVLSPVAYYSRSSGTVHRNLNSSRRGLKKRGRGKMDLLEKVLKRHSLPIRPCNSYSFFVMASWGGVVKSSSFGETSKMLGEMWGKLPHTEKKVFEDMALKDNARYKKQSMMLTS